MGLESSGGGSFKDPNYQKYEACRFPFYANYLQEDGDWKEIWASSSIGEFQNVTSDVYIRPGNSYRVECIFNTSNSSVWVTLVAIQWRRARFIFTTTRFQVKMSRTQDFAWTTARGLCAPQDCLKKSRTRKCKSGGPTL